MSALFDLTNGMYEATINLSYIPDVLQLAIESLHLDERVLTEDQGQDIIIRHEELYNTISLTQRVIIQTLEELDRMADAAMKKSKTKAAGV